MKFVLACIAALLWQAGEFGPYGTEPTPLADPQHLRYERALTLPSGVSGMACAVLDASLYAHAASWSAGDLRIFRATGSNKQDEIPFAISYSEAQPSDAVTASVRNLSLQNGDIMFDLMMPPRPYTVVDLQLAARDFIAKAEVFGEDERDGRSKSLGTFALFDLTKQHLARSTSLALEETHFSRLHIRLHLYDLEGDVFPHVSTSIVEGATVPASREAQTLYRTVATTHEIMQMGRSTVARMDAPAHVPIERVSFVLDQGYKENFLRSVSIDAAGNEKGLTSQVEAIGGEIWRVTRPADARGNPAIHAANLALTEVIESNLRENATVKVTIENGNDPPLPIKAIKLEMRQRTICFDATAGSTYTLRYGDDALRASVYDLDGLAKIGANTLVASLGPEELNRHYIQRGDVSASGERETEIYWITMLAVIATLGAIASRHSKRQGRRR